MSSLSSCVISCSLLLIFLQFYLCCCPDYPLCPMSHCRHTVAFCLMVGIPFGHCPVVASPSAPCTVASHWSTPVLSCLWLLTAFLSAYPGVSISPFTGLLMSWCSVPGRFVARTQHFQVDISSCLCSFCSWLFTVIPAFHLFCRHPGEEILCSDSCGTE